MKIAAAILAVLLGNVASFPQNQGAYPYPGESSEPTDKQEMCTPGEIYYFWCDDKVQKHRYPRQCVGGYAFDHGDRTPCTQAEQMPDGPAPTQDYAILQPNPPNHQPPQQPPYHPPQKPPHYPPQQPPYHPPQKPPHYPPQQPPHYPPQQPPHYPPQKPPQYPPQQPPRHPPQQPPQHPPQQPPHYPPEQYYEKPQYAPPGGSSHQYPEYSPNQAEYEYNQQHHNNHGYYSPKGKPSMLQTLLKLYAMQKLVNKDGDGADNSKFKDLLKYYLMFQGHGMQGGNNHQLLALMYGLPGMESSSSLDMSDILKYLIGNSGGMGGMGALAGMGGLGDLSGLAGMGALGGDMDGLGGMAGLFTNPMLAGLLDGDGDNSLSSLFGLGGDNDSMSIGTLMSLMGHPGLGGNTGGMPPMGFPPMGDGGLSSLYPGTSHILNALLSMKGGS